MALTRESIAGLAAFYADDVEILEVIDEVLNSFADYHNSIYKMETSLLTLNQNDMGTADYQSLVSSLDSGRTISHNAVIVNVSMLNRLAELAGQPPIYEGVISKERPYRREVANAVLEFVQEVISDRR